MKRVDISTTFAAHPDTGNLLIRTEKRAVAQALANLISTNRFERPFNPDVGGNLRPLLFEQISKSTATAIRSLITETINNNETRINLDRVEVKAESQRNRYVVTLVYYHSGEETATTQQITLTRVR